MSEKPMDNMNNENLNNNEEKVETVEAEAYYSDLPEDVRLERIDQVMKRTKVTFSEAKAVLEEHNYNLIDALGAIDAKRQAEYEETKQKIRDKYEDVKDLGKETYRVLKKEGMEGYNQVKDILKEKDIKGDLDKACDKVKNLFKKQ